MLKRRFIACLFAGVLMVNLGHNIVPHHHHTDSILSHRDCRQQDEGKYAFHPGDPASHCHAFNGIEYYPAPETQSIIKPFKTVKDIFSYRTIQAEQPATYQKIYRPSGDSPLVLNYLLGSSTGLRAPPVVS